MQIWDRIRLAPECDQIPAPIRTLFCIKPESFVHVTEVLICDCLYVVSTLFIFGARNFIPDAYGIKTGAENCIVCHAYNN